MDTKIDTKQIFGEALLALNTKQSLDKITVAEILKKSGFSRQTFYNHFLDKQALIQYVYEQLIIPNFSNITVDFDFAANMRIVYQNLERYRPFMQQACRDKEQNNLSDYLFQHCYRFDHAWYQLLFGGTLPTEILIACQYHAHACTHLTLDWLEQGDYTAQELVDSIVQLRQASVNPLFAKYGKQLPY